MATRWFYMGIFNGIVWMAMSNQLLGTNFDGGDKAAFGLLIGSGVAVLHDVLSHLDAKVNARQNGATGDLERL